MRLEKSALSFALAYTQLSPILPTYNYALKVLREAFTVVSYSLDTSEEVSVLKQCLSEILILR